MIPFNDKLSAVTLAIPFEGTELIFEYTGVSVDIRFPVDDEHPEELAKKIYLLLAMQAEGTGVEITEPAPAPKKRKSRKKAPPKEAAAPEPEADEPEAEPEPAPKKAKAAPAKEAGEYDALIKDVASMSKFIDILPAMEAHGYKTLEEMQDVAVAIRPSVKELKKTGDVRARIKRCWDVLKEMRE